MPEAMDPVTDEFLLTLAGLSAGLTGLFLVGMVFYIQSGYEQHERSREVVEPYFRAATIITFVAYAIPLGVALTLVALPLVWSQVLYWLLLLSLIVINVSTVTTVRQVQKVTSITMLTVVEVVGSIAIAAMIILPLATGGLAPNREELTPPMLISLGIAFFGTCVLVLSLFDIARFERAELEEPRRSTDE